MDAMMVVAKAEFAQSYIVQARMARLRSFSVIMIPLFDGRILNLIIAMKFAPIIEYQQCKVL
jgi:hypothetical protein